MELQNIFYVKNINLDTFDYQTTKRNKWQTIKSTRTILTNIKNI